jgi:hypothetical protein
LFFEKIQISFLNFQNLLRFIFKISLFKALDLNLNT